MSTRVAPPFLAALTGLFLGLAMGLLVADGRWWPLLALPLLAAGLMLALRVLVPPQDRVRVAALVALAFAFHVAVAISLYTASLAIGLGGFITGDDRAYASLSSVFAEYLHGRPPDAGPPYWGGEAYLFGTWVYIGSAIFFVIGREPLVPILLNAALAVMTALMAYDIGVRLFDRSAAFVGLALSAFFPSLVLWSSLDLKDALALALIGMCLVSLVRFHERPAAVPLLLALAALVPLESLRSYIFVALLLLVPFVVLVTPRIVPRERGRWSALAAAASVALLLVAKPGVGLAPNDGPDLLTVFENERASMAIGARTAFVPTPSVAARQGSALVVAAIVTATPGTVATSGPELAAPSAAPRIVEVTTVPASAPPTVAVPPAAAAASTTIPVSAPPTSVVPSAAAPASAAAVPVAEAAVASATPATTPVASAVPVPEGVRNDPIASGVGIDLAVGSDPTSTWAIERTAIYLPTGLLHAVFAPFPWDQRRTLDLAVAVDMVIWYVIFAAAVALLIRQRARWNSLAPLAGLILGMLLIFALVEGNAGTLYRHRAMVIPWTAVLSGPVLAAALLRARRFATRWRTIETIAAATPLRASTDGSARVSVGGPS